MDPVIDYPELMDRLNNAFQYRYQDGMSGGLRLIGLVFARPESPVAKTEMISQIPYWHCRSGDNIDFFFAGYTYPHPVIEGFQAVPVLGHADWLYSPKLFNAFRTEIESQTQWRYSGACDLLLSNAFFDATQQKAVIDWKSIILCQLDQMLKDKAIDSIEKFFESVFRFAESHTGSDSCWGFSDQQGLKIGGSALKQAALSLLPKGCAEDYRKAEHFAVRNVGAR
jgi:hypothetical protein